MMWWEPRRTSAVTAVVSSRPVAGVMEEKNSGLAQLFGSPEVCSGPGSVAQKILNDVAGGGWTENEATAAETAGFHENRLWGLLCKSAQLS